MQESSKLLQRLVDAEVDFVVIGGVAANLHGASYPTQDFDVAVEISVENCRKILNAIGDQHPRFYQTLGKPPVNRSAEELSAFKNLYFSTDIGIIDLLGSVPPLGAYERVKRAASEFELFGLKCRVISLDDLIEVKAFVGRPKDKLVEVELRAIRARLKGVLQK